MDCILARYPKGVTCSYGAQGIGLPDHELIYCTNKIFKKRGLHKQIKFHFFKLCKVDFFEQE